MNLSEYDVLDFTEYQEKAYSTCTPQCYTDEYLNLGYLSECGELAGKLAKRVRGDVVSGEDIMQEIGDVAWMIATQARKDGYKLVLDGDIEADFNDVYEFLDHSVEDLFWAHSDKFYPGLKFRILQNLCESLGFDFAECLKMNNEKLASRQQRGVIQGNGDNRLAKI